MYLEISPRRTGKTTRLIEAAYRFLKTTNVEIAIVACDVFSMNQIAKRIREDSHFTEEMRHRISYYTRISKVPEGKKLFVDEFDRVQDLDSFREDGYYVTTRVDWQKMIAAILFNKGKLKQMNIVKDELEEITLFAFDTDRMHRLSEILSNSDPSNPSPS